MTHIKEKLPPPQSRQASEALPVSNGIETVISIKNISKKYRIAHRSARYTALRDNITYALLSPFQTIKNQMKKILARETKEEFWALKNINLDVKKGEVIGIIGRNGAGKSTLLKILTGITPPTEGEIKIKGKVVSLLEVGTGFHPELTGRENIFLNGAILGMTKRQIEKNFDKIVAFSGIERFIDTPVKRCSSGMYVRLAFSVAAHLEPDILLVDEVLAVGDADFQKKCLGKMDEVTKTQGRTILFVSHNMDAVSRLCKTTVLLEQGKISAIGDTDKIIELYLKGGPQHDTPLPLPMTDENVTLTEFSITQRGKQTESIDGSDPFGIHIGFSIARNLQSFRVGVLIKNSSGTLISRSFVQDWEPELEEITAGHYNANLLIPARLFMAGEYLIEIKLFCFRSKDYFADTPVQKTVTVHSPKEYHELASKSGTRGYFLIPTAWNMQHKKAS